MLTLATILSLLPPELRDQPRAWAGYTIPYLPLAASAANVRSSVTTQDGSTFILTRIKAYATDTAAPPVELPAPQATFTLSIGSLSFFPDNNAQHVQPFAVSAGDRRGHELEFPMLVDPNTSFNCLMTNLTATAMNVRVQLYGVRIWTGPRSANSL